MQDVLHHRFCPARLVFLHTGLHCALAPVDFAPLRLGEALLGLHAVLLDFTLLPKFPMDVLLPFSPSPYLSVTTTVSSRLMVIF